MNDNSESLHFNAASGEMIEVDFTGKTFDLIDRLTDEATEIIVFVGVLPFSQYIYAEGMISTTDWIAVNN